MSSLISTCFKNSAPTPQPFRMILSTSFLSLNHGAAVGCFSFFLALVYWSRRGERQGKPKIPKHILYLIPLFAYGCFLEAQMPFTNDPPASRTHEQRTDAESPSSLRYDLDHLEAQVNQLNQVVGSLLGLGFYAMIFVISDWLVYRMDDRHWTHGGIRPPPGAADEAEPKPSPKPLD